MAAPTTAQVYVVLAEKEVWINPPNFVSLSMKRLAGDTCNSFTLQVMDNSAFDLEYALLNNTGGDIKFTYRDQNNSILKEFEGYVLKMSDSFIDDRVMLTVEGFVGIKLEDKFQKISFAWNTVPKFDWTEIFSDANNLLGMAGVNNPQAYSNDDIGSNFFGFLKYVWDGVTGKAWNNLQVWYSAVAYNQSFESATLFRQIQEDPEQLIDVMLNNLKVDEAGNYYLPNRLLTNDYELTDLEASRNVKQSGTILIPMCPHKIVKLIAKGGNFSELIPENFDDFKGTSIYDGENEMSTLDWLFVRKWYQRLGYFKGCGWKMLDSDIEKTDMIEADFTQTKQSYLQYIQKVLMPNSVQTTVIKKEATRIKNAVKNPASLLAGAGLGLFAPAKDMLDKVETLDKVWYTKERVVRTNFVLSFTPSGYARYKRVNITNAPEVKATYYIYGDDRKELQNSKFGKMISFSPTLDVLTSMITAGAYTDGDISNINLVTGEPNQDQKVTVNTDEYSDILTPFDGWGKMAVTLSSGSSSQIQGRRKLEEIQDEALKQCYKAKATIEGYCNLNPQDYISICVIPKGAQGTVLYHHTSGNYYILSIEESIESGRHYCNLDLVKNVGSLGTSGETVIEFLGDEMKYEAGRIKK
ncbi:MAG: hypothetical protein J6T15_05115 [Bacilli bacterium]|nr:hypothetical protein [Bacilli bacterium]